MAVLSVLPAAAGHPVCKTASSNIDQLFWYMITLNIPFQSKNVHNESFPSEFITVFCLVTWTYKRNSPCWGGELIILWRKLDSVWWFRSLYYIQHGEKTWSGLWNVCFISSQNNDPLMFVLIMSLPGWWPSDVFLDSKCHLPVTTSGKENGPSRNFLTLKPNVEGESPLLSHPGISSTVHWLQNSKPFNFSNIQLQYRARIDVLHTYLASKWWQQNTDY